MLSASSPYKLTTAHVSSLSWSSWDRLTPREERGHIEKLKYLFRLYRQRRRHGQSKWIPDSDARYNEKWKREELPEFGLAPFCLTSGNYDVVLASTMWRNIQSLYSKSARKYLHLMKRSPTMKLEISTMRRVTLLVHEPKTFKGVVTATNSVKTSREYILSTNLV